MRPEDSDDDIEAFRCSVKAEAQQLKDPMYAIDALIHYWRNAPTDQSNGLTATLNTWILSEDADYRYDGMVIARELRIISAVPVLHRLHRRLQDLTGHEVPFEIKKVEGLIAELEADD